MLPDAFNPHSCCLASDDRDVVCPSPHSFSFLILYSIVNVEGHVTLPPASLKLVTPGRSSSSGRIDFSGKKGKTDRWSSSSCLLLFGATCIQKFQFQLLSIKERRKVKKEKKKTWTYRQAALYNIVMFTKALENFWVLDVNDVFLLLIIH